MPKTKRFFISDVHLGLGPKARLGKAHSDGLLAFLKWVTRQDDVKDLVLLGDIFDTWMFPMDQTPLGVHAIAEEHADVVEAIKACAPAVEHVFFVNGNHDMHVTQEALDAIFGERTLRWIPRYLGGLLYAEHGSRFAMFNATDRLHDPADGYPLGYFITRILASTDEAYDRPGSILGYVDNLLEAAVTTETLAESVIEALMEMARKRPDDEFVMPGGRRNLTIRDVQRKYKPLFTRWVEKFGPKYALESIRGEMGTLGWFADRLCDRNGFRVVVLGHTHNAMLDKDAVLVKTGRIYANAGTWCGEEPTFIEVDKLSGRFVVSLLRAVNGDMQRKQEASIDE